ncbi:MAG: helix-turn-helix transcriptional regulator [Cyanothece sp. SIO1E1]|nr:helix-turn-helix transcriptional regulator [Cyanothece sp. SIO1E1]
MRDRANPKSVFVNLREKLGLTQKQVAEAVGVTEQTIRNWEHGKVVPKLSVPQMKRLCEVLRLPIEEVPDYFGPVD